MIDSQDRANADSSFVIKPAMCNMGPPKHICEARLHLDRAIGREVYLRCNALAPHNGLHHDTHYEVYWREDSARMARIQGGWKDGKRPAWMREEDQYE